MPLPLSPPVNHARPPPEIFPIDVDAPPVEVLCYVYSKDGEVLRIVSHGRQLLGSDNLVWLFGQPLILKELGYTVEDPMPDASFQMYYHRSNDWLPLPEHNRPIIIQSDQALLWRRTGVTAMPDLATIIQRTAVSDPLPRSPDLPSTPIRGLFSLKSLTSSPSLRADVGLLNPAPSKPPRARFLATVRPGRMARAGGKKPPQRLPLAPSSPPRESSSPQSSSPPASSQVLRGVFGDNWKSSIPKRTSPPSSPRSAAAKHRRSLSPETLIMSKRPKPATCTPSPLPVHPGSQVLTQPATPSPSAVLISPPDDVRPHSKKVRQVPVNPSDIIDISEDTDDVVKKPRPSKGKGKHLDIIDLSEEVDEVVEMPRPRKGKGKAKAKVPIPADAEFVVLSD
ncbi:hypothetical protein GSI_14949 [Ganoderma sinense ZZ0214-1]|uniref:Uncharacterized protein n=1 Tax=Ganoderma sinense ZZ0214-1 TaxID=1077348 RepID=A0A2G8RQ55_9APHY|nr:hypothetical protein GSI_14949 [Ganoderma sinense ZZ0214-1]